MKTSLLLKIEREVKIFMNKNSSTIEQIENVRTSSGSIVSKKEMVCTMEIKLYL